MKTKNDWNPLLAVVLFSLTASACVDSGPSDSEIGDSESETTGDTGTSNSDDTGTSNTDDTETSAMYCEWEDTEIPIGGSTQYVLPSCLNCSNYVLVFCDDQDSDGLPEISEEPTDCLCTPETCYVEGQAKTVYAESSWIEGDTCCLCSAEFGDVANSGAITCTDGPCDASGKTCEYDGVQYPVGAFGPAFPCDAAISWNPDNGCLCEIADGQAVWKCMMCMNALAPQEGQSVEMEGHCCTHLKYGSPAMNSSYLQCSPGECL